MVYNIKKGYERYIKDIQMHSTSIYFFREDEVDKENLDSFMELIYNSINDILSTNQYKYGEMAKLINIKYNNFLGCENTTLSFGTEYAAILDIPLLGNFTFNEEEKDLLDTLDSDSEIDIAVRKIIHDKAIMYIKQNKSQFNYELLEQEKYFIIKHSTGLIEYVYKDLMHLTANKYKIDNKFIKLEQNEILYKYGNITISNTGRIVFIPCNEQDANNILVRVVAGNDDDIITDYDILYEFNDTDNNNSKYYFKDIILQK